MYYMTTPARSAIYFNTQYLDIVKNNQKFVQVPTAKLKDGEYQYFCVKKEDIINRATAGCSSTPLTASCITINCPLSTVNCYKWLHPQGVTDRKLQLKPLAPEQLSSVLEIDRECLGGLWTLDGYQREIASPNSTLLVLSLIRASDPKEKILGFGCLWAVLEEAHITILAIKPHYQSRGLGQLLLYSLLQDAVSRSLERVTLEVRSSNQVAISLYQKFGFKIAGRRKNYYQNGEDALILWRGGLHRPQFQQDSIAWQQQIYSKLTSQNYIIKQLDIALNK